MDFFNFGAFKKLLLSKLDIIFENRVCYFELRQFSLAFVAVV